jgi:hypothetical protein
MRYLQIRKFEVIIADHPNQFLSFFSIDQRNVPDKEIGHLVYVVPFAL